MRRRDAMKLVFVVLLMAGCNRDKKSNDISDRDTVQEKEAPVTRGAKNIIFFGNSLTAGYGVEQSEAFPALIQARIDSLKLSYKVINAGLSGETTASVMRRIEWVLQQQVDVFILELGGNDGLRGIPLSE